MWKMWKAKRGKVTYDGAEESHNQMHGQQHPNSLRLKDNNDI